MDKLKYSPEAEGALVGSRLIEPSVTDEPEVKIIKPGHFHDERHRWIWKSMDEVEDANKRIDIITVTQRLEETGRLKDPGDPAYLVKITNSTPTHIHAREYAIKVREDAIDRKTNLILGKIAKISNNRGSKEELEILADELKSNLLSKFVYPDEVLCDQKTRWTAEELLSAVFPEPQWVVPGLIPEGLINLGGRPKLGKSWLALQLAHAKSTGGVFLGKKVDPGKVLFIALEDNPRRLKDRAKKQGIPIDAQISFDTAWRLLPDGGLDDLKVEIAREEYSFIIIDTISRAVGKRIDQLDIGDTTQVIGGLQNIAIHNNLSILLVDHHKKKVGFENNPVDDVLGSTGKTATADTLLGLYRPQGKHEATLMITGRDIEEQEIALSWDGQLFCWQNLGDANEVRVETQKGQIIQATRDLVKKGELPTTTRIATHIGTNKGNVSRALADLVMNGKIKKEDKVGREVPYYSVDDIQQ